MVDEFGQKLHGVQGVVPVERKMALRCLFKVYKPGLPGSKRYGGVFGLVLIKSGQKGFFMEYLPRYPSMVAWR